VSRADLYAVLVRDGLSALAGAGEGGGAVAAAWEAQLQRVAALLVSRAADEIGVREAAVALGQEASLEGDVYDPPPEDSWGALCSALLSAPPLLASVGGSPPTFRFADPSICAYLRAAAITRGAVAALPAEEQPYWHWGDAWRSTLFFGHDLGRPFKAGLASAAGLADAPALSLTGRQLPPLLLLHLVEGMPLLRDLDLTACGITAAYLRLLLTRTMVQGAQLRLHALTLDRNPLGDGAASALSGWLAFSTTITTLNLRATAASNQTALDLATALGTNQSLRTLALDQNPISDAAAGALRNAKAQVDAARGFTLELSISKGDVDAAEMRPTQCWLDVPAALWGDDAVDVH